MFASLTATKAEDIEHMLIDDESGSSSDSENEYIHRCKTAIITEEQLLKEKCRPINRHHSSLLKEYLLF
ncbi:hypothetical protein Hanom_Chr03g00191191 [Helianthus anomalus]